MKELIEFLQRIFMYLWEMPLDQFFIGALKIFLVTVCVILTIRLLKFLIVGVLFKLIKNRKTVQIPRFPKRTYKLDFSKKPF